MEKKQMKSQLIISSKKEETVLMGGLLHEWKRLKSPKEWRVRSTYLKMFLAEVDEQICGTRGNNGHANVDALQSGKTLKAAKKDMNGRETGGNDKWR